MYYFSTKFITNKLILMNNYKNIQVISNLKKIILHFGLKNISLNPKKIISAYLLLGILTNQRALLISSKKSLMILKIKKNMIVSCKVTLRKKKLFLFLNKFNLINFYKNSKDWSLLNKSIFKNSENNYKTITIRISEFYFFPEIERFFDFFEDLPFLTVTFVTNSRNIVESKKLFSIIGLLK